mgnify:CR=1 FL=1
MSRACNTARWKQVVIAHIAGGDNKVQAARAAGKICMEFPPSDAENFFFRFRIE